jgi:hypothetical protein
VDLSNRLKQYYFKSHITNNKGKSYIYSTLLEHGYSSFSLTIFEYLDIMNLYKYDAIKLILEHEQYFIDILTSKYNILKLPEVY